MTTIFWQSLGIQDKEVSGNSVLFPGVIVNFVKSVLDDKEVNLTSKSTIKCDSSVNTFFLPEK